MKTHLARLPRPFRDPLPLLVFLLTALLFSFVSVPSTSAQAPAVIQALTNKVVAEGSAHAFALQIGSIPPNSGVTVTRWTFKGAPIPNEFSTTLVLRRILPAMAGRYSVTVSNALGVTESSASLTVVPPTAGNFDPSFILPAPLSDFARATAVLSDGRILIAGGFTALGSTAVGRIARLLPNGALDPAFRVSTGADGPIYCLALLPSGKIMIGGAFSSYDGQVRSSVARLNADGSLDLTFDPSGSAPLGGAVWALALGTGGQVFVGGDFSKGVALFSSSGVLDPAYPANPTPIPGGVRALLHQGDSRILVGGEYQVPGAPSRLLRLTASGVIDPTFNPNLAPDGIIMALTAQPDGKILVGGSFLNLGSAPYRRVARLQSDGAIDLTFRSDVIPNEQVSTIAVQQDGRILIGGGFTAVTGVPRGGLARLAPNGTLDLTFNRLPQSYGWVEAIVLAPGGNSLVAVGNTFLLGSLEPVRVTKLFTEDSRAFAPVVEVTPVVATVGAGSDVFVPAQAIGSPVPQVKWLRNGNPWSDVTGDILALRNVRVGGGGLFTLVASNSVGSITGLVANITVTPAPQTPGAPDIDFYLLTPPFAQVTHVEAQSDRKAIFVSIGSEGTQLRRVDLNGTLDDSFQVAALAQGSFVSDLAIQGDGKIFISGFNQMPQFGLMLSRLSPNGIVDPNFQAFPAGLVRSLFPLPDGRLLIGGDFHSIGGHPTVGVAVLKTNGAPDTNFVSRLTPGSSVSQVIAQADGRFLVAGTLLGDQNVLAPTMVRLDEQGRIDPTFDTGSGPNSQISALALQDDGKILVAGRFTRFNGYPRNRLVRLFPDGSVDQRYDFRVGANHNIEVLRLDEGNRLLIGGLFTSVQEVDRNRIARLNPDGTVDLEFNPFAGADERVLAIAIHPAGEILIGGRFARVNQIQRPALAKLLNAPAKPLGPVIVRNPSDRTVFAGMDVSFSVLVSAFPYPGYQWFWDGAALSGEEGAALTLRNVELQQSGSYGVRVSIPQGGVANSSVANLTVKPTPVHPGAPDISFYPGLGPNATVRTLLVDGQGRTLVGGSFTEFDGIKHRRITRLDPDGSVDPSFNPDQPFSGTVLSTAMQPDGKILVGGTFTNAGSFDRPRLARLNADGTLDTSFKPTPKLNGPVQAIAPLTDGNILVGGFLSAEIGTLTSGVGRLKPDGSLDSTFMTRIPPNALVYDIAVQPDRMVLVGGSFNDGVTAFLTRLQESGARDTSFSSSSFPNGPVNAIALQPDGKILIGGAFSAVGNATRLFLARLEKNGTVDPSFVPSVSNQVYSVVLQADGKILIGGLFEGVNGTVRPRLARLLPSGALDPEFEVGTGLTEGTQYLDEYANLTDLTTVQAIALQPDGQILVGGDFHRVNLIDRSGVVRINDRERPPYLRIDSLAQTGTLGLRWVNGYLQTAEALGGPWTDLPRTRSPHPVSPSEAQRYFRLRLQ